MMAFMHLKVLLPDRVFLEADQVKCATLSSSQGSQGVYPRRRDFVASLVPGIFSFEQEASPPIYLAVDWGIAVKTGPNLLVSTHNASQSEGLGKLRETMEKELLTLDEVDQNTRVTLRKLESDMLRRMMEFRK